MIESFENIKDNRLHSPHFREKKLLRELSPDQTTLDLFNETQSRSSNFTYEERDYDY